MSVTVDRRAGSRFTALGTLLPPYPGGDRREPLASPGDLPDLGPVEAVKAPTLQRVPPASTWLGKYRRVLLVTDFAVLTVAAVCGVWLRFGASGEELRGLSYYVIALVLVVAWWFALACGRCYETRFLGSGPEEFQRIANTSVRVCAAVALFCYAVDVELARGFVAFVLPTGTLGLVAGRYTGRLALQRRRRRGRCGHRVVVLGTVAHVQDLALKLSRDTRAGLCVVGACIPGAAAEWVQVDPEHHIPVVGSLSTVTRALELARADTLAVCASPGITPDALRHLSYEMEGTGVELVVAPALTNVAGTRVSLRPVAGLPLLHIDEPELTGARKLVKDVFDRSVAIVLTILMLPVLMLIALAVRLTSRGPALFRQRRVGRDGQTFTLWKFRSMYADAEQRRAELVAENVYDGVLFKVKADPRVTPVGQFLRRHSLDELPQLFNVLLGDMSLVGPRPPLSTEVEEYDRHAHRRLLVKPGMTGLWQVSGRSDLSWDETVRLDLQYIESWSLALDISLLAKTFLIVVRGTGAY
jgi:exopolysaccharide biosynthesis polyprenyl glycosylphosphotransferase